MTYRKSLEENGLVVRYEAALREIEHLLGPPHVSYAEAKAQRIAHEALEDSWFWQESAMWDGQ